MVANDKQVGGKHYASGIQHWDYVVENELDYFQGQITKYVTRWRKKNGIVDLEKALHFLEKYIEVEKTKLAKIGPEVIERHEDCTGQVHPFGYDANTELGKNHPLLHAVLKDK